MINTQTTIISQRNSNNMTTHALYNLTKREKETLILLSQGLSNKEIADKLYVSQDTIK